MNQNKISTYAELLEVLQRATKEQLGQDITIMNKEDEYFAVTLTALVNEDDNAIDIGHLYFANIKP